MGLNDRPYAGTWQMNRTLVRYTPDCLVYVNGYVDLPGCPSCRKNIPLQKYITNVSVNTSTDPLASATLSLQVPKHSADAFGYDGNWTLQPGLEIVIQFRGYFPQRLKIAEELGPVQEGELNPNEVPLYPYYQVFRGVVTEVSHEFSGGFYSASLSCSDMLHFWQNLYLSTNGSVFGTRPPDSGVAPNLVGHSLTGMSPFSIMYTLVRAGFGAAFGVEFKLGLQTNIDDAAGAHLIKPAALWWEKRFNEASGNLRMYGMDGSILNMFAQAYLGLFQTEKKENVQKIIKSITVQTSSTTKNPGGVSKLVEAARKFGYDPSATQAGVGNNLASQSMMKMQTYALDFGQLAQPSFFGSEYMSKLEIANAVKAITGYEFYQDVDGDIVFKPPFYNLDTSSDPVFVIEDRDLISINESSREPEATMVKGTGLVIENVKGTGLDDWTGKGATYIDYRLVAQFGWKEGGAFESNYLSNPQAIFVSAINRLDMANIGMNTAEISIPMRPELRAGYPIYVRHLDCFYYVKSLSHSFTFGGGCTTNISGVARRRKFLPPGSPPGDGKYPTLDDVKLGEPGKYPALPLYVFPQDVGDGNEAPSGPPRIVGFPNVVFALDAHKIDVGSVPGMPYSDEDMESLVLTARRLGIFQDAPEQVDAQNRAKFRLPGPNGGQLITREELRAAFTEARNALVEERAINENAINSAAAAVLRQSVLGQQSAIQDEQILQARMTLAVNAKALFAPGMSQAGQYRYFSSSHSSEEDQGPYNLEYTESGILRVAGAPDDTKEIPMLVSSTNPRGGVGVQMGAPTRGVSVATSVTNGDKTEVISQGRLTSDIRFVSFAQHSNQLNTTTSVAEDGGNLGQALGFYPSKLKTALKTFLYTAANRTSPGLSIHDRFDSAYTKLQDNLSVLYDTVTSGFPAINFSGERTALSNLDSALTTVGVDGSKIVTDIYGNREAFGMNDIAGKLAGSNGQFSVQLMNAVSEVSKSEASPTLTSIYQARDAFFRSVSNGILMGTPVPKAQAVPVKKTKASKQPFYTPIFPVSDQNGYEVYGGLPYGRGLDLVKHYEVSLGSPTDDIGGIPVSSESFAAIERFYAAFAYNNFNVKSALDALKDPKQAALVAAAVGVNSSDQDIQAQGIEVALQRFTQEDANRLVVAHNTPVNSSSRGMSYTGRASAENLGRLQVNEVGSCNCKGADGSFYLQAFSGGFADIEAEGIQGWLEDQVRVSGEAWAVSKAALAGTASNNQDFSKAWEASRNQFDDNVTASVDKIDQELQKFKALAKEEWSKVKAQEDKLEQNLKNLKAKVQ